MNEQAPAFIYLSTVMHSRRFPVNYRFSYRVFSLCVDIDRLAELDAQPWFSRNRFNLVSLYERDHGRRDGSPWRAWVENVLQTQGISADGRIQLVCFPRILGYGFNPLSLWFCHNASEEVMAVICEVRNTFGEHHHYVLHQHNQPFSGQITGSKDKIFHVSPFVDMQARYNFFISPPGEQLNILIHEFENQQLMLIASQRGQRLPFTTAVLLRCCARIPLLGAKIMALIHWQALKIWLKGGTFYPKPAPPTEEIS